MEGCTCCRGIDFSHKTLKGHIDVNVIVREKLFLLLRFQLSKVLFLVDSAYHM